MRTLFRQGKEAEIIVYYLEATMTHSHFTAKITIHTRLDELKQKARDFFDLAPKDCHLAFKDRHGLEVYVNEVNFERIKENIHVEKLFKVITYEPEEMAVQ
jgi:hypothetical protein